MRRHTEDINCRLTDAEWEELNNAIITKMAQFNFAVMEEGKEWARMRFERLNKVREKLGMDKIRIQEWMPKNEK